jgi:FMN reductase
VTRIEAVVVAGSVSRPSRTLQLAEHILSAVARESAVNAHVVDLAEVGSDLGRALSRGELSAAGERAVSLVERADLLIAATPVYRGSYTGHFKHLFDLIEQEALLEVPVILAATGGGDRHCLVIEHQLRPLFAFLQAFVVPVGIYATPADFRDGAISSDVVRARIVSATRQALRLARPRERIEPRRTAWVGG